MNRDLRGDRDDGEHIGMGHGPTDATGPRPAVDRPLASGAETVTVVDFDTFHREHRDRLVRSLAMHLGDLHLATEAVDEAMVRAWQHWHRLDDRGDAGAWVYRVARNWATSWFRRRRFRSEADVPDQPVHDDLREVRPHLRAAVAALSDPLREVVVLRLHADFSTAATARALDIPTGTVKSRLSRALDQLRTHLEDPR